VRALGYAVGLGVAAALWSMAPPRALAQGIAFQSASSGADVEPLLAFDHTSTPAVDAYLVVAVAARSSGTTVLSVTHGGAALAQLGAAASTGYCRSELWGLAAPAAGTNRVEVTLSGGGSVVAVALSYAGVEQTAPRRGIAANFGNGSVASVAGPATAGQTVIDALCANASSTPAATAGPGQNTRYTQNSNNVLAVGGDTPGAAGQTLSYDVTVGTGGLGWSLVAVALAPATPPADDAGTPPDGATPADAAPDGAPPDSDGAEPDAGAPRDQAPGDDSADAPGGAGDDAATDVPARPDAGNVDVDANANPATDAGAGDANAAADAGAGDAVVRARDIDLAIGCACRAAGRDPAAGGPLALLAAAALALSVSRRRRRGPRAGAAPTRAGASPSSWPPPPPP
jgi:MYXO-CTERM domain-containing protein